MNHHKGRNCKLHFSDRNLKRFCNGNPRYIADKHHNRLHDILSKLAHGDIETLKKDGRYRFHSLSLNRKGFYAIDVDENNRVTFRLEGSAVRDIALEDYH